MDDKIVAIIAIAVIACLALWLGQGNSFIDAAITGIAGITGYAIGKKS